MGDLVKMLHYFLLYPHVWQSLLSSLFTLSLVWFLVQVDSISEHLHHIDDCRNRWGAVVLPCF